MGLNLEYIYGQTPIDEDEKEGLKIKTISTRGELDEFEQANIEEAVEWSMKRKHAHQQILTVDFIRELHKRMFSDVWTWAGTFRKTNKNIGVDKTQIHQQLLTLLDDCKYWIENKSYCEDEIAIRFKHRLVTIHPFPNGNGRHSRLCADILVSQGLNESIFSWGGKNLTEPGEQRSAYLDALHRADDLVYEPLMKFARS